MTYTFLNARIGKTGRGTCPQVPWVLRKVARGAFAESRAIGDNRPYPYLSSVLRLQSSVFRS